MSVAHLEGNSVFFSKIFLSWDRTCGLYVFLGVSFQLHCMKKQCFKSNKMKIDFYILSGDVSPNVWANSSGDLAMFRLIGLQNNIHKSSNKIQPVHFGSQIIQNDCLNWRIHHISDQFEIHFKIKYINMWLWTYISLSYYLILSHL